MIVRNMTFFVVMLVFVERDVKTKILLRQTVTRRRIEEASKEL